MSSAAATKFMIDKLNACAKSNGNQLVAWVSSRAKIPGQLSAPPAGVCYETLNFDRDTTVSGTSAAPTVVYVRGDITVGPAVKVNIDSAAPAAPALLIYSTGGRVTFDGTGASGPVMAAGLWAPLAECATNGAFRPVSFFGSLVCSQIANNAPWRFNYDDQFAENAQTLGGPKAWSIVAIDGGLQ